MSSILIEVAIPDFTEVLLRYWRQFVLLVPRLIFAVLIVTAAGFVAGQVARLINKRLINYSSDPLLVSFIAQIGKWVLMLAGLMLALSVLGFSNLAGGLIAGAGVSALVIGFAFKDIGENFLAGIIMAFNRPFHVKDTIGVDSYMGKVVALGLRSTRIKTADGRDVYIPNSIMMKSTLTNYTADGQVRLDFTIGIQYSADLQQASRIILERISGIEGVDTRQGPFCTIEEFTAAAATLHVYFWTHTYDYTLNTITLRTQVMQQALDALKENDIPAMGFPKPA